MKKKKIIEIMKKIPVVLGIIGLLSNYHQPFRSFGVCSLFFYKKAFAFTQKKNTKKSKKVQQGLRFRMKQMKK